jgi:hypothetical protein
MVQYLPTMATSEQQKAAFVNGFQALLNNVRVKQSCFGFD